LRLWERAQDPKERGLGLFLLRLFLSFLSLLFFTGVWLRNALYDLGLLRSVKIPCFVISVGNLTVGGTGKTPVVMHLAKMLSAKGKKVAVLTRGTPGKDKSRSGWSKRTIRPGRSGTSRS
jgi:tetraacyldisaccharide 4'-kinase